MKKKGRKTKNANPYRDLEGTVDHFDMDQSDDGLSDDGRILLENAKGRRKREGEQEVLNVYHSSDSDTDESDVGDDEEGDESDQGSMGGLSDFEGDVEDGGDDGLPDAKAWGSKRKAYYDTDYVDKDFMGFDDEEVALMEEQEANEIQKRIMTQMEETDFSLGLLDRVEDKKKLNKQGQLPDKEKVEKDLTKLSRSELIDLIKRETPGFFGLLKDCKAKIKNLEEQIMPILEMEKTGELPECEALDFIKMYQKVIYFYMMNTTFFMLLKSQKEKTDGHPIVKRLGQISMYLTELESCLKSGLGKQIKKLIEDKNKGYAIVENVAVSSQPEPSNRREKRKLKQIEKQKLQEEEEKVEKATRKLASVGVFGDQIPMENKVKFDLPDEEEKMETESEEEGEGKIEKRPASQKILKNRGLTPRRKKEVRNPRVRNRNKFKKAVVRRKGQVREVRKELSKYDGERSGIKKNLSKSISLK